jgi:hypothetical protein
MSSSADPAPRRAPTATPALRLARRAWKLLHIDSALALALAERALARAVDDADAPGEGWARLARGIHLLYFSRPQVAAEELRAARRAGAQPVAPGALRRGARAGAVVARHRPVGAAPRPARFPAQHDRRLLFGAQPVRAGLCLHVPGAARRAAGARPRLRRGAALQPRARAAPARRLPRGAQARAGRAGALRRREESAPGQRAVDQPHHRADRTRPGRRGAARPRTGLRAAGRRERARRADAALRDHGVRRAGRRRSRARARAGAARAGGRTRADRRGTGRARDRAGAAGAR